MRGLTTMKDEGVVLRAENVCKRFGGVQALDNVSFELRRGEVHALVGENGAGKSTLIKIICGVYTKDSGRILYQDKEVDFRDNLQARMAGIGIVPQEIQLAPKLTVAENIFMGMYPRGRAGLVSWRTLHQRAHDIARTFNMEKFIDTKVEALGTGHRQLIEILKALIFETRVIAFDEPTAALSDEETQGAVHPHREPEEPRHLPHLRQPPPGRDLPDRRPGHRVQGRQVRRDPGHRARSPSRRSSLSWWAGT